MRLVEVPKTSQGVAEHACACETATSTLYSVASSSRSWACSFGLRVEASRARAPTSTCFGTNIGRTDPQRAARVPRRAGRPSDVSHTQNGTQGEAPCRPAARVLPGHGRPRLLKIPHQARAPPGAPERRRAHRPAPTSPFGCRSRVRRRFDRPAGTGRVPPPHAIRHAPLARHLECPVRIRARRDGHREAALRAIASADVCNPWRRSISALATSTIGESRPLRVARSTQVPSVARRAELSRSSSASSISSSSPSKPRRSSTSNAASHSRRRR